MLTPAFELTQSEEFLIVSIQIPYAKVSDIQVHFEDFEFVFYSKPYHLRLNLPGRVSWCETPNINYNDDKKIVVVQVPKAKRGEIFEGLDLVTMLLSTKKSKTAATPLIEVIDGTNLIEDDDEFDWSIEQVPSDVNIGEFSLTGQQCGFADSYSFVVFTLKEESSEIFDVKDPQQKSKKNRTIERKDAELKRFDEEHYLADLYNDDEIQELMRYHPEWDDLYDKLQNDPSKNADDLVTFTTEEKERLRKLPSKEYLLEKSQAKMALLGLIDIIFAYAYDKRTTFDESTVESAWTINKLSATLSWLETFSSVPEVAVTCIRRSLIYPLFRHFELSLTVLEDVRKILLLGRKYIIKCLLGTHQMFCASDPRYILNDLYITDYCVWLQTKSCSTQRLVPLAEALGKVLLTKGDIGLNLVDIESFAAVAWMAHNSTTKTAANGANSEQVKLMSHSSDTLCADLEKLSLKNNLARNDDGASSGSSLNSNTVHNDFYQSCSSCTSDSSDSSSNSTFDTDSSEDSNSDYTDSDDSGSETDSDESHQNLLRKVNEERIR
ncbi:protein SHQ1 homolog [Uloborus diversus]|uniref:protein SHQ1 homolog n=1 Tax=Uloborus diversus TaxID=327109 RepID=UPI00240A74D2|nr:protein SHQ1 homolog [Uloborus diversus]